MQMAPSAVVAVVVVVAWIPLILSMAGATDRVQAMGGDFPAFYAAGSIVLDGEIDSLYDPEMQRRYQRDHHDGGGVLYFAYPPIVAVAYAPLAMLPYGVALTVHSLAALVALAAASRLLIPSVIPHLDRHRHTMIAVAAALVSYPVLTAVLGGQNTTFTLLALAVSWTALVRAVPIGAGLAASVSLFKPQFGLLLGAALALTRSWAATAWFAVGAVAFAAANAIVAGRTWLSDWVEQVRVFGEANDVVNGWAMIDLTGWLGALGGGSIPGWVGTAALVLVATVGAWSIARSGATLGAVGCVSAWILLVSPSTLFYDLGVALVAFAVFVATSRGRRSGVYLLAGSLALSWTGLVARDLGWNPTFLLLLAMFILMTVEVWRRPAFASHPGDTLLADPASGE